MMNEWTSHLIVQYLIIIVGNHIQQARHNPRHTYLRTSHGFDGEGINGECSAICDLFFLHDHDGKDISEDQPRRRQQQE